jgi:hypothetical protein
MSKRNEMRGGDDDPRANESQRDGEEPCVEVVAPAGDECCDDDRDGKAADVDERLRCACEALPDPHPRGERHDERQRGQDTRPDAAARVAAYASVIDAQTNDPTYVQAQ